jgi:hypothetical protein
MSNFPTVQKIVLPDNGNESFRPNDTITIMVDPQEIGLLNGKDSYLRFRVKLSGNFKATLDREGGGGFSILSNVSIWNGNGNTQIENLGSMPMWCGIKNHYDNTQGLENIRNLLEGLQPAGITTNSPYFINTTVGVVDFTSVECVLPMYQSGILYGDSACPVAALNGLMIKIQLAPAAEAITALNADGFIIDRTGEGLPMAPVLAVPDGTMLPYNLPYAEGIAVPAAVAPALGVGQGTANQNLPQCFQIAADIPAGPITSFTVSGGGTGTLGTTTTVVGMRANVDAPADQREFPWVIGQTCGYLSTAGDIINCGAITNITWAANIYTITFAAVANATAATVAGFEPCFVQLSNRASLSSAVALPASTASYTVEDVELVCSVVEPDNRYYSAMMKSMQSAGGYSWDIRSFSLYRNNLSRSIAQSQELIPTVESRTRGLLMAQVFPVAAWNTSYNQPISDYMRNYQYVLGQTNVPLIPVSVDREFNTGLNSWNATADEERLKALGASKIDVKYELHPAGSMCVGREVARIGHSANLNTTEVRFNQAWGVVDGGAGTVSPQKNKILKTYVHHFRKITATPDSVVVTF